MRSSCKGATSGGHLTCGVKDNMPVGSSGKSPQKLFSMHTCGHLHTNSTGRELKRQI